MFDTLYMTLRRAFPMQAPHPSKVDCESLKSVVVHTTMLLQWQNRYEHDPARMLHTKWHGWCVVALPSEKTLSVQGCHLIHNFLCEACQKKKF